MSKDQNNFSHIRAQEYCVIDYAYTKRVILLPVVKMKDTALLQSLQRALRVALVFV